MFTVDEARELLSKAAIDLFRDYALSFQTSHLRKLNKIIHNSPLSLIVRCLFCAENHMKPCRYLLSAETILHFQHCAQSYLPPTAVRPAFHRASTTLLSTKNLIDRIASIAV